jgi:hypoxanthine phosphoribosyltransferase
MNKKLYFSYSRIHKTIKKLAGEIELSRFNPELMVAIGTGGFIPARIMKTFLNIPILTVGIRYYNKENILESEPEKMQWIDEVEKKLEGKRVLLVDEVDDTRSTLEYCLKELLAHKPAEIAVAVLHKKEKPKKGKIPDEIDRYFCGEVLKDVWCCYPWDALDIDAHEKLAE